MFQGNGNKSTDSRDKKSKLVKKYISKYRNIFIMYYDLLAKLKNATMAKKEKIIVPFSKMDAAILRALVEYGYIKSADVEIIGEKSVIVVRCAYKNKTAAINDFKIVSKPSRRFYFDYRSLRPVKQGYGVAVLSTSKGIMTNKEAKKNKIGGEYLFEIW